MKLITYIKRFIKLREFEVFDFPRFKIYVKSFEIEYITIHEKYRIDELYFSDIDNSFIIETTFPKDKIRNKIKINTNKILFGFSIPYRKAPINPCIIFFINNNDINLYMIPINRIKKIILRVRTMKDIITISKETFQNSILFLNDEKLL